MQSRLDGRPAPTLGEGSVVGLVLEAASMRARSSGGAYVLAPLLHAPPELGVEVVRLGAGGALVEVRGDLGALAVVDLPREQVVDLVQRFVALRLERGGVGCHGV